jgi:hypothetical protein
VLAVPFSPRPALLELRLAASIDELVVATDGDAFPVVSLPSDGPPALILRI